MQIEKAALIVNPAAGYNTGKKIYKDIYDNLSSHFNNLDLIISEQAGDPVRKAKEATEAGYNLLITLGGDGTAFEVLNGMMQAKTTKKPALSFIPSGSGNSFLRDFDIVTSDEAINRIINGKIRNIDMIEYSYQGNNGQETAYYINILGTGFVSRVAEMRLKHFRMFRSFGYTIGVLLQIIPLKKDAIVMELDGKPYEANNNFISICNSKYTGGEMMMAPRAQVDDGKLDVVMLNDAGRLKLLNSFPKIFNGTHIDVKEITYLTGKTLEIKSPAGLSILADGEILGKTPLKAQVLPKKLSVLI